MFHSIQTIESSKYWVKAKVDYVLELIALSEPPPLSTWLGSLTAAIAACIQLSHLNSLSVSAVW